MYVTLNQDEKNLLERIEQGESPGNLLDDRDFSEDEQEIFYNFRHNLQILKTGGWGYITVDKESFWYQHLNFHSSQSERITDVANDSTHEGPRQRV